MHGENPFAELIHDYVVECLPLAEEVAARFLTLERQWRDGTSEVEELRHAAGPLHTVKGNSAMLGLGAIQGLAHALEDAATLARRDPGARTPAAAALLVEGGGLLVDLVRTAATREEWTAGERFTAGVRAWLATPAGSEPEVPAAPASVERRQAGRRASDGPAEASSAVDGAGQSATDTIRVDFRRLDELLEVLGEAVIGHAGLADVARRILRRSGDVPEAGELDQVVETLGQTLRRLERAVMQTRLLPIATVFGRFPRVVRDLARSEQKHVQLVTTGGETLLDKTILDRLGEPLVHLLTNAVVHGVEAPEERARAGKPAEARVELRAAAASGRVVVTLRDDGRGLDLERIRRKARDFTPDADRMDEAQLGGLIFQPHFSTAERVSALAGRGVGLDVVARSIRALNGTIDVATEPGRGVTFTLSLPLTLAIVRSLVVEVDRERYAVPIDQVTEAVRVNPDAIHQVNQQGVAEWRDGVIHVADGGTLLGSGRSAATARRYCVVLGVGGRRRGLLVDRLIGRHDAVVKPLDNALGAPELVSGTTILADGQVACVLDAGRILDRPCAAPGLARSA